MQDKGEALNFENYLVVIKNGLSNVLALFLNSEITVDIKSYSMHHIGVMAHVENDSYQRFTEIYGHPESDQKQHTRTLL